MKGKMIYNQANWPRAVLEPRNPWQMKGEPIYNQDQMDTDPSGPIRIKSQSEQEYVFPKN